MRPRRPHLPRPGLRPGRLGRRPPAPVLLGLLPVLMLGALVAGGLARLDVQTSVADFVPRENSTSQTTARVASAFGGDPVVALIESQRPEQLLTGPRLRRLLALEGRLAQLSGTASVYGPATVLNQIAGRAQTLLTELTAYRDALRLRAQREALQAGKSTRQVRAMVANATLPFDQRYGALLGRGLPAGLPTLHNPAFVRAAAFDSGGAPRPQWRFVLPRADAVAISVRPKPGLDQQQTEALVARVRGVVQGAELDARRVTVSGVPAIVSALGQQVRREIPLLGGVAAFAVGAGFLLVRWARPRRRLLPLLATLAGTGITLAAFGWAGHPVSLGAVAFLPVLLGVGSDFMAYLQRAVPTRLVVAAAAATAAGFAALWFSPVPVAAELGLTLAAGILVSLAVGLSLSAWMARRGSRPPTAHQAGEDVGSKWLSHEADPQAGLGTGGLPRRRVRVAASVAAALVAGAGWASLPSIPANAGLDEMAGDLPEVRAARHVERVLGAAGEVSITVHGEDPLTPESLRWMRRAQNALILAHGDRLHPILSPPSLLGFLGPAPSPQQVQAATRLLPDYLKAAVVNPGRDMAVLSFGAEDLDAAALQRLRRNIRQVLPDPPSGLSVTVSGLPMVAASSYAAVSTGLLASSLGGIAAAVLVLGLLLRRRTDALRALASAVLSTGIVLLALRLGQLSLTPLTAAVGSLTAAVACEFTVVLAAARRRRDRGMRRAVLLAAAASATGYAVLMLSQLAVLRQFGALLATTVLVAVSAAVLVVRLSVTVGGTSSAPRGGDGRPERRRRGLRDEERNTDPRLLGAGR